ncbi:19650_t:CDS:2, partial [Racocetra fulgida]
WEVNNDMPNGFNLIKGKKQLVKYALLRLSQEIYKYPTKTVHKNHVQYNNVTNKMVW